MEGLQIEDRLGDERPGVEDVEGAHNFGEAGKSGESEGGEVDLLAGLQEAGPQLREQIGPSLPPRALSRAHVLSPQAQPQVVVESAVDRAGKGARKLIVRDLARRHPALAAGRPN